MARLPAHRSPARPKRLPALLVSLGFLVACSDGGPTDLDATGVVDTDTSVEDVPAPAEAEPLDTLPSDTPPVDLPDLAEPDLFVEPDAPGEVAVADVAPDTADSLEAPDTPDTSNPPDVADTTGPTDTTDVVEDLTSDTAANDVAGPEVADTADAVDTHAPDPVHVAGDAVRCISHGWCWDLPTIGGAHVNGLWGASADGIWAVGSNGAISYFDGQTWLAVASPVEVDLEAVHGTGPSDVWAVGADGEILHFDGQRWERSSSGVSTHLRAVWARAADDVWAVGNIGTVLRWNGSRWTQHASGVIRTLRGVSGYGTDEVWMVGDHATILHYDGDTITKVFEINSAHQLNHVAAVGPGECWAVGNAGLVRHQFVGAGSTRRLGSEELFGITATAFDDLWVVGDGGLVARWDGLDWDTERLARVGDLRAVWTDGASAKAGGRYGARASFGGTSAGWDFEVGHLGPDAIIDLVVTTDLEAERAYALTARSLYRREAQGWSRVAAVQMAAPAAMWVAADDDIWVVGANEAVARWNGHTWTPVAFDAIGTRDNRGIWGSSPDEVFIAAGSDLYRWNGTLWLHQEEVGPNVLAVIFRDDQRYIVTSRTVYYRHPWLPGWRAFDPPASAPLFTSVTHGADGRFYLTTGTRAWIFDPAAEEAAAWRELTPPQFNIQGAWGLAANDVWVLGIGRELRRWNGVAWSNPVLVPASGAFELAASPERLYAYSWAGHVLRWHP